MIDPVDLLLPAGVIALFFAPRIIARLLGVKRMTPAELKDALKKHRKEIVVLDVRSEGEFSGGHIKDAWHLPLGQLSGGLDMLSGFKTRQVVCVCASGIRSALAAIKLKKAGFEQVYNLSGGMRRWERDVAEDGGRGGVQIALIALSVLLLTAATIMNFPPSWVGMDRISAAELSTQLAGGVGGVSGVGVDVVVVDVRTGMEYSGGHIDGAISMSLFALPFKMGALRPHRESQLVLVCLSGHRSRLAGLLLKLGGFKSLSNLDGGMAAWRRRGGVETRS